MKLKPILFFVLSAAASFDTTAAVHVHVQSLLPTRDKYAKHNPGVLEFNQRIMKLAADFNYDFIDLHKLMVDEKGELKTEFTKDGLHINDAAYALWRTEILKKMGW